MEERSAHHLPVKYSYV